MALREHADELESNSDTRSTIQNALHRAMIKIKSALNNDRAIAVSCAEQEGWCLQAFGDWAGSEGSGDEHFNEHLDALSYIDLTRHNIVLRTPPGRS